MYIGDDLTEICQWETFSAECQPDEVIIITDALYGRMRHGKCIKTDAEHVGCHTNVRSLADVRCSGRRKCQIEVPDKLFDGTQTACKEDLKSYLMASYVCLKGMQPLLRNQSRFGLKKGSALPNKDKNLLTFFPPDRKKSAVGGDDKMTCM